MQLSILISALIISTSAQASVYVGKCFINNVETPEVQIKADVMGSKLTPIANIDHVAIYLGILDGAAASMDLLILEIKDSSGTTTTIKSSMDSQTGAVMYSASQAERTTELSCQVRRSN